MKKSNVAGLIVIALFVIGIAVALMQYKREQTYSDEQKNVLASEKVVLSADENLFGMTTTDAPENYDITKDYYENYDNAGLEKYVIPIAFMDEKSYIFGIRETKYCQYVYIDDSQDIVVEMTKEQREKWISKLKEKIDDILQQQKESKVYNFNFEKDYKTLQIDVTKEVLDQEKMTSFMSYLTALLYHSEIYQVLNGNTDWAVQVITEDWDTGKELINIEYPDEGFRLSDENWENI